MDYFWKVATSLYRFWYSLFENLLASSTKKTSLIYPTKKTLTVRPDSHPILVEEVEDELPESEFKTFKSVIEKRPLPIVEKKPIPILSDDVDNATNGPAKAVVIINNSPLYKRNTKEFDSVIKLLPYGAGVDLLQEERAWAQVKYQNFVGWVERDSITARVAQAKPYFVIKEYCGPDSENTKRLRLMIADVFNAVDTGLPLHCEEYIYYKLFSRGIVLPKVDERPRAAGRWQDIFKGKSGVHVSIRPKTGSIIEFTTADEKGHLAYIEAVFPDESISLSEVGLPEDGYYNERILSKEIWLELKPVFIQFS